MKSFRLTNTIKQGIVREIRKEFNREIQNNLCELGKILQEKYNNMIPAEIFKLDEKYKDVIAWEKTLYLNDVIKILNIDTKIQSFSLIDVRAIKYIDIRSVVLDHREILKPNVVKICNLINAKEKTCTNVQRSLERINTSNQLQKLCPELSCYLSAVVVEDNGEIIVPSNDKLDLSGLDLIKNNDVHHLQ